MNNFQINRNNQTTFLRPGRVLCLWALFAFFAYLTSCSKKDTFSQDVNELTNPSGILTDRSDYVSPTPELDWAAFKDKVSSEYESNGRMVFEHLAYFQGDKTALDYFPASVHPQLQNHLAAFNNMQIRNTIPEAVDDGIAYIQADAELSVVEKTKGVEVLEALEQHANALISQVDADNFNSFGNIWYYLKNQEQTILNDALIPEHIKQALLSYNSFMRNYLKYEYMRGGFEPSADDRGDGNCFLGYKLKCWFKYGLISYFKIVAYVLVAVKTAGAGAIYAYILIAAEIASLAIKMESSECKCSSGTTLEEIKPCKRPEYLNVDLNGCGLTQKLKTWDYGNNYGGDFLWVLAGATAPDTGNEGNIVSRSGNTVVTHNPWLVVTQTSPGEDVIVQVSLFDCNLEGGGETRPGIFNFHELTVTDAGTITVAKLSPETTTEHAVQIGTQHKYYTYGTALMKAMEGINTISVVPNNYGAVVQTSGMGIGEVMIQWNLYTVPQQPFTYLGKVIATAQGICNAVSNTDDINVAVQLP